MTSDPERVGAREQRRSAAYGVRHVVFHMMLLTLTLTLTLHARAASERLSGPFGGAAGHARDTRPLPSQALTRCQTRATSGTPTGWVGPQKGERIFYRPLGRGRWRDRGLGACGFCARPRAALLPHTSGAHAPCDDEPSRARGRAPAASVRSAWSTTCRLPDGPPGRSYTSTHGARTRLRLSGPHLSFGGAAGHARDTRPLRAQALTRCQTRATSGTPTGWVGPQKEKPVRKKSTFPSY